MKLVIDLKPKKSLKMCEVTMGTAVTWGCKVSWYLRVFSGWLCLDTMDVSTALPGYHIGNPFVASEPTLLLENTL